MTVSPASLVFLILGVTTVLFLWDVVALELVALLSLLALYFCGVLTPQEALSGFSNSVVVTLAALFVISGALFRTGVAAALGDWMAEKGGQGQSRLVALVMGISALLSAFMSSTGTAAVLIPAVMGVARRNQLPPSRLLLPLAYGCLIGGMLTLVGTAPNLVVQEALKANHLPPFGFFSFLPMGAIILAAAIVYMGGWGVRWLGQHPSSQGQEAALSTHQLASEYRLSDYLVPCRLDPGSPLLGQTLAQSQMRSRHGVNLLGIQAAPLAPLQEPSLDHRFEPAQILHLFGSPERLQSLSHHLKLTPLDPPSLAPELLDHGGIAEILLTPRSRLLGQTLQNSRFQERYRVNVLALRRMGRLLQEPSRTPLKFGDTLLVAGAFKNLEGLYSERGSFVVTGMPEDNRATGFRREKAPLAIGLTLLMLVLMSFELVPSVIAVLLVAALALLTGCLTSEEAYRSISWSSLLTLCFILPSALALEKTGGVQLVAQGLLHTLGSLGPVAILAGLFLLTTTFSQFISNTATTIVITPIALQAAAQAQVAPHAYLMAVAVAASAAFLTPVASPVNTLVLAPGAYRFSDFVKVGLPLQLLVMLLSLLCLPLLFPL